MKNIISLFLLTFLLQNAHSQSNLIIADGHLIMNGDVNLILKNTNFTNNGTFTADDGTVKITGDATSEIGGISTTTFHNLSIDKSANNASLTNDATINNQLNLTNGKLDLSDYNLMVENTATIDYSENNYVKTSGLGSLVQEVGSDNKIFPVGVNQLNFMSLTNDGTVDNFYIRCEDGVLSDGDSGDLITEDVVNTTWYVSEEMEGDSDVSMTATWYTDQELTNFDRNNSYIWHYTNGAWKAGTSQTALGSVPYYATENNIMSFSPFTVSSSEPLPIKLLSLVALPQGDKVQLKWTTATEINSDYFEVQHSMNGQDFAKIGKVQAAGYSQSKTAYDFLHHQAIEGINYYRLKQFDKSGKYEYSSIVNVEFIKNLTSVDFLVHPNPTSGWLYFNQSFTGKAVIRNTLGQIVWKQDLSSETSSIHLSNIPSGQYYLEVISPENILQTTTFIVQQ